MVNSLEKGIQEAYKILDQFDQKTAVIDAKILSISKNFRKLGETNTSNLGGKDLGESLSKNTEYVKQLNAQLKEQEKINKALQAQISKLSNVRAQSNTRTQQEITNQGILRRNATQFARANSTLATTYEKISAKLIIMKRRYKDLAAAKEIDKKLTKQETQEYKRLEVQIRRTDSALKRIDKSTGESFRNVGNYRSALGGLANGFRGLASAFGLTSGAMLFAAAIRDGFERVREFDKSMQNLAGVMRTSRGDLKVLEEDIIRIASTTVRTSNEVAKLAETLSTLGKGKDEISNLLKPIIDLSLGLDASSDEAGEFLIQMLNTFGESSDKAAEFADTIATIRTSTTLDFQKMRDSFQYIAPISRILGRDLAYTGAVVGILADNGLKAESAGRLLSTAQIKLATQGKTLTQALEELNEAKKNGATNLEVLSVANDLFGKQAAKIGAILALNTDAIDTNAQAIRDNGGALEDLTNEQLESLDAKIKIVDSSYERFILNLDNGTSKLGTLIKNVLDTASKSFGSLDLIFNKNTTLIEKWKLSLNATTAGLSNFLPFVESGKGLFQDFADEQLRIIDNSVGVESGLKAQRDEFVKLYGSLAPLTEEQQKFIDNQEEINLLFSEGLPTPVTESSKKSISDYRALIKALKEDIELMGDGERDNIKTAQDQIAVYERKINKLLGVKDKIKSVNKENKKMTDVVGVQKDLLTNLIGTYKRFGDELTKSFVGGKILAKDYFDYLKENQDVIKGLEDGLGGAFKNPLDLLVVPENAEMVDKLTKKITELKSVIASLGETTKTSFQDLIPDISNTLGEIGNLTSTLFDRNISQIDDLIQKNSDYYTDILAQENLSEEQRSAIEAERALKEAQFEKKKRDEQRKQAIANKAFALAEIAINTAVSISKTAATLGFPAATPFIVLSAIQGALQTATVLATPIPQFKDGHTSGTYEGVAMINDQKSPFYQEIVERVDGSKEMYTGRDQLINMNKGDKVHTASASENMILNHLLNTVGGINPIQQTSAPVMTDKQMDRLSNKMYKAVLRGSSQDKDLAKNIANVISRNNRINKI